MANCQQLTAIVVGGGSGIGLETVKRFLKSNVAVAIGDLNLQAGRAIAESLSSLGTVFFVQIDITKEDTINAFMESVLTRFHRIDMAVCTVGYDIKPSLVQDTEESDLHKVLDVNLLGVRRLSKALVEHWLSVEPRLIRDDSQKSDMWQPVYQRGSMVITASGLGLIGAPYMSSYVTAKHGVIGLAKCLALENAAHGIRFNVICPGITLTPIITNIPGRREYLEKEFLPNQPLKRFAHPSEIASAIYFTVSDGASFMLGTEFCVDGGVMIE